MQPEKKDEFSALRAVNQVMKSAYFLPLTLSALLFLAPQPAYADNIGLIFRGVAKTVGSVLQVPFGVLSGSTQSFPFGIISGALGGTVKAVSGTISGAADIARGAGPYAKYLVFL